MREQVNTYVEKTKKNMATVVCHEWFRKMADVISTFVFQAEKNFSFSYWNK